MAKTITEWLDFYVAELSTVESTSDEEAIKQEVAEFEAKLRETYAEKKASKLDHLNTAISVINELVAREKEELEIELKKQEEVESTALDSNFDGEQSYVLPTENELNPFDELESLK